MSGNTGTVLFWPRLSQPKQLNVTGNAVLKTKQEKTGDSRTLQTAAFQMEFSGGKEHQSSKPIRAETLAAGTMEWTDSVLQGGTVIPTRTQLQADKLAMDFVEATGKPRELQAIGNVRTERWLTGRPVQTATANTGTALMSPSGGWSQMDLQGDVKLKDGDRSGQADHAAFDRVAQTATLTGHAIARDATTETRARRIVFSQAQHGDIRAATGGVRSVDFSAKASAVQLAPAPANITSDMLEGNSKTGRALYTGNARLWQGDSVLQANSIELLRDARVLNASGNVRAVFPQAAGAPAPGSSAQPNKSASFGTSGRQVNTPQVASMKPQLWHATSDTLTYNDVEGLAHLTKNVVVQSADQKMRGPVFRLYFTRTPPPGASAANSAGTTSMNSGTVTAATAPSGAQRISPRSQHRRQ